MIEKTFEAYDKLELKIFAERLLDYILVDYPYIEESFVLTLSGRFGCGKTTFLEMFCNYLKTKKYETIQINSWEDDFFDDPCITIFSQILDYFKKEEKLSEEGTKKKVIENIKETALKALSLFGKEVIKHYTGVNIQEAIEQIKGTLDDSKLSNIIYEKHQYKKELINDLNLKINEYVNITNKPLFILVDELDRTRPDYAVKFLEVLKHFFKTKGVVFILAMDKEQLCSSIKRLYGNDINFHEYYRKFSHKTFLFPKLNKQSAENYINKNVEDHFNKRSESVFFVVNLDKPHRTNLVNLCLSFKLTPRQIDSLFRACAHFFRSKESGKEGNWFVIIAAIVYITLITYDESLSSKITANSFEYIDLLKLLKNGDKIDIKTLLKDGIEVWYDEWWMHVFYCITSTDRNFEKNIDSFIQVFYPERNNSLDQRSQVKLVFMKMFDSHDLSSYKRTNIPLLCKIGQQIQNGQSFLEEDKGYR